MAGATIAQRPPRRRRLPGGPVAHALAGAMAIVLAAVVLALVLDRAQASSWYESPFEGAPSSSIVVAGRDLPAPDGRAELEQFLPFVVNDIQRFWREEFQRSGLRYVPAQLVVFQRVVPSGCGLASAATGPFYCTRDRRVYLDLGFFRQLAVEFQAPGDFAQAYVVAHEFGHHVQNLTGITAQVDQAARAGVEPPNALSIRMELQADCFAGVWAHSTYDRGLLERGDLQEALRAAAAVGDDRIQARTTGRIDPETWTHGSSAQRAGWFRRGFENGDPKACDTFSDGV